jgi:hypothetical protein
MDLGNILAREGNTPLTGRIVKFMIQGQSEGVIVSALASARPSFPVLVEVLKKIDDEDVYDDIESLKVLRLSRINSLCSFSLAIRNYPAKLGSEVF